MVSDRELLDVLDSEELKELLTSASVANARDLVQHDLLRRRGEIELELSSTTAARDEAVANQEAADVRVRRRLETGWHRTRLFASLSLSGLGLLAALASVLLGWSAGRELLATWQSPFVSGWIATAVWTALYAAVAVAAFEADFYLRRLPARRQQAHRDENLADLRIAVDSAQAARRKQLVALLSNHVTEILNSSQGPKFGSTLRVRSDASPGKRMHVTLGVGLSEVTNDDNRVATGVQQRLVQLLTSLPGASIGISGPRGVGKSTLLAALCGANPTIEGRAAIAISTSAPVEYDGREFLLHLFSSLCHQVLRTEGREDAIDEDGVVLLEAQRWRRASLLGSLPQIRRLLALVGMTLVGIAFILAMLQSLAAGDRAAPAHAKVPATAETSAVTSSSAPSQGQASAQPTPSPSSASSLPAGGDPQAEVQAQPSPTPTPTSSPAPTEVDFLSPFSPMLKALAPAPLLTLGIVALSLSLATSLTFGPYRRDFFRPEDYRRSYYGSEHSQLVGRAVKELRNIGFQRSYTSGWSGSLKVPIGLDMTSSAGLTLAQRPESLPELVERFRSFVRDVAQAYDNVVLIGIDELDKLKSAQQAEAFLNGIKSVFGIPRCFFLISVSEHALAAFERRGIGFRDAFDSALDDIVQVSFLDLKQSRVLLNRRILRLPDPFLQLCYMLSGGLPRDLIRHARALLECATQATNGSLSLKKAVEQMIARDLTARLRATSIAMHTLKEITETGDLLVTVSSLPSVADIKGAMAALTAFRAHTAGLSKLRDSEKGRVLLRIAEELAVYYEIMILLRRVAALLSTRRGWERATTLGFADQVAGVRQALEAGVPLAEVRLAELRKAVDGAPAAIDCMVNSRL